MQDWNVKKLGAVDSIGNVAGKISGTMKPIDEIARNIQQQFLGDGHHEQSQEQQLRVVLYSHDTMGVGHMRRNLLIASQITRSFPQSSVLVIAGAKEAATFAQQAGIDCLTLPSYLKNSNGSYSTRNLGVSALEIFGLRNDVILAAIKSYKPNLFVVDKVPAGAGGELFPTLDWLESETQCHCVLGLRDILDSPQAVAEDWNIAESNQVIQQYYSSIWIYGDPKLYDPVREYRFSPAIADMVNYTGYLNTESRLKQLSHLPYEIEVPYVLCTVGGGQDGDRLANCFITAMRDKPRKAVLLMGPYMPQSIVESIRQKVSDVRYLKVVEFADEGDLLIRYASHVVSMGGYNTVSAIMSHRKTALIVPRCAPRQEQLIRAERLAKLRLVASMHPDNLQPEFINAWLEKSEVPAYSTSALNINGLNRISHLIEQQFSSLLNSTTSKVGGEQYVKQ